MYSRAVSRFPIGASSASDDDLFVPPCKEFDQPRHLNAHLQRVLRKGMRCGSVSDTTVPSCHGVNVIEVRVPSTLDAKESLWIRVSRGFNHFAFQKCLQGSIKKNLLGDGDIPTKLTSTVLRSQNSHGTDTWTQFIYHVRPPDYLEGIVGNGMIASGMTDAKRTTSLLFLRSRSCGMSKNPGVPQKLVVTTKCPARAKKAVSRRDEHIRHAKKILNEMLHNRDVSYRSFCAYLQQIIAKFRPEGQRDFEQEVESDQSTSNHDTIKATLAQDPSPEA